MPIHTQKKPSNSALLNGIKLAKDYFLKSNERYFSGILLAGSILSVISLVGLSFAFSWWSVGFWAALTAMSLPLFVASMKILVLLVGGYIGISVLKNYLVEVLSIRWRNWLTQKLIQKYTSGDTNYLELMRLGKIDNPQQRIQEDTDSFVSTALSLTFDLLKSALSLIMFIGTLWVVGGSLSFAVLGASITIPGYLVWAGLVFSAAASFLTHKIGRALEKLTRNQKKLEADFRKEMDLLNNDAESIAEEHGEGYYKQSLLSRFREIYNNSYKTLRVNTHLVAFQSFYYQMGSIFPYIAAAPLYFAGLTSLGQLMQIGFAFQEVNMALNWFVDSYATLATYKASVTRIVELDNALENGCVGSTKKGIIVRENNAAGTFCVKKLNIAYPSSTGFIMRGLNLQLNRFENTLIKGPSGLGKSTLFKVMAGTWKYGDGEVTVPNSRNVCFLPQRPSLPNDTLMAVLAYPETVDTYPKEQYIRVLRAVGTLDKFISELDTKADWSKRLSGGQQQRISFARALLKKPDWLFLDEATASLDTKSETHLYTLLKKELVGTTFISIAHRPTVDVFHKRIVTLDAVDEKGEIHYIDQQIGAPSNEAANDENAGLPSKTDMGLK